MENNMDAEHLDSLKSLSVLYVEDDLATREELAEILAEWVGTLHVASNGQEGLDIFLRDRPDIVLTDIQMPVLNGLAMSSEIRRTVPGQPIVVISAYNDMEFLFRAIDIGINHYVTKPINVQKLLGKLAEQAEHIALAQKQRRTQRLLEQYRILVDQSAIVLKLDPQRRITYANEKFRELTGYDSETLVGLDLSALRHHEAPIETDDLIWQTILDGKTWAGIVKNKASNGEILVVESSLVPILNDQNELEEVVCLDVDITSIYLNYETLVEALGRSERSLKEQRHYLAEYKRALELGTCICITDANGGVISANRQFAGILGYEVTEMHNTPLTALVPECRDSNLQDLVKSGETHFSRVMTFLRKDGTEMVFSVVAVVVHDLDGNTDSVILVCQDITESLRLTSELMETQRELLFVMGEVVENRSQETGQHVKRVAEISKLLALKSGMREDLAEMIKVAAPMHDVGKVAIPDRILHKPGRLDSEEYQIMQTHAVLGYQMLNKLNRPMVQIAARIAHEHHEHYDGKGYPCGLSGTDISLEGRIVAIADVFDALSHDRVYKTAWNDEAIRAYFLKQRGTQFDPALVDLLFQHWDDILSIRNRYRDA